MGTLIRRSGAFSVQRGGDNRAAEQYALRVLAEARFPIIIFPEGHTFYLNDVLLPLKPGAATWSVEAARAGSEVYVVPIVIKYHYAEDIRASLDAAVADMERMVLKRAEPVPPGEYWSRLWVRLHRLADVLLTRQERLHHYQPPAGSDIDERVQGLCHFILQGLEKRYLGAEQKGDFFSRSRHLMALIKDDIDHHQDAIDARFAWALSTFYAGYLSADSSPERFAETVQKLQRELTRRIPLAHRSWRQAHVRVGEPLHINDYINSVADPSRAVLDELAQRMRSTLAGLQPGARLP
jgi:hypothetical protein